MCSRKGGSHFVKAKSLITEAVSVDAKTSLEWRDVLPAERASVSAVKKQEAGSGWKVVFSCFSFSFPSLCACQVADFLFLWVLFVLCFSFNLGSAWEVQLDN